ncbi:tetraspanin family protein [Ancylostoma duodenale]|uniref:Tetraspanin family protein n=1 Tax=Ancylostoma duodenale TaxID=51022 RepID=A0A0C2CXJ4_9BILA|nr:tetraspanin family protein [Ancylostoma duodenale]
MDAELDAISFRSMFIGCSISIVSLIGSVGALRDNIFLLKTFAICVFFCYIVIVVATCLLFILFYSDSTEGFSAHTVLVYAIKNYHTNRNLAEIVDSLQENLECCGVSSAAQGYRDWNLSYQFNCSTSNPQPEKCGVPFSCCRKSVISEADLLENSLDEGLDREHFGSSGGFFEPTAARYEVARMLAECAEQTAAGTGTRHLHQRMSTTSENVTHPVEQIKCLSEPVLRWDYQRTKCISVCLTNVLAKQIDHQRLLLEREARRNERHRKRERHRIRTAIRSMNISQEAKSSEHEAAPAPSADEKPPFSSSSAEHVRSDQRTNASSAPPLPNRPKNKRRRCSTADHKNARIEQWVLQQSDLVKPNTSG